MRAIRRGLDLAALALAGAVVAAVLTGGTGFELGPVRVSLHSARNPALLLGAVVAARLVLSGRLRPARCRRRFRLPEALLWAAGSVAYALYSRHLGLPLFWGGYFAAVLLAWLASILAAAAGLRVEFSPPLRRPLLWVWAAAAVFYFAAYSREPHAPRSAADRGIWTRYDQRCYYRMAREIAGGSLNPSSYRYGLGYPVLAVPFLELAPVNPFFPAGLLLYLLAVGAVYRAGTSLLGRPGAFLAAFFSLGPA
ncbi:MAG TPA: hypothetical protein PK636_05845, partial [bacterium]|nr:hypothetical protein [bacterium]